MTDDNEHSAKKDRRKRRRNASPNPAETHPQEASQAGGLYVSTETASVTQEPGVAESPSITQELSRLCLAIIEELQTAEGRVRVIEKSAQIQGMTSFLRKLATVVLNLQNLAKCLNDPSGNRQDSQRFIQGAKLELCRATTGEAQEVRAALARLESVIHGRASSNDS